MLTIRARQLELFRQARVEQFIGDTVDYLATEFPKHIARLGRTAATDFVRRSLDAAAALRFENEGAIVALIELWLVYGEQLERAPRREWARNILAHPRLPDTTRIDTIRDRLDEATDGRVLVVYSPAA